MRRLSVVVLPLVLLLLAAPPAMAATPPKKCRYLSGKVALLPFPNDAFTKRSGATPTKRRVAIPRRCAPANKSKVRIDTTDQNRLDGFSPGSQLILKVSGLSTARAVPALGDRAHHEHRRVAEEERADRDPRREDP